VGRGPHRPATPRTAHRRCCLLAGLCGHHHLAAVVLDTGITPVALIDASLPAGLMIVAGGIKQLAPHAASFPAL
jgi:hypothetical protein